MFACKVLITFVMSAAILLFVDHANNPFLFGMLIGAISYIAADNVVDFILEND